MERSGVRCPGCYDDGVIHCAGRFQRTHNLGDFTLFLADGHVYTDQVAALLVDDSIQSDCGLAGGTVSNDQFSLATADGNH